MSSTVLQMKVSREDEEAMANAMVTTRKRRRKVSMVKADQLNWILYYLQYLYFSR